MPPPIPDGLRDPDTSSVENAECAERLVGLKQNGRLRVLPAYFELGLKTADPRVRLRESVARKLNDVASSLPPGLTLVIWDGLRTLETQNEIAEGLASKLAETVSNPDERARLAKMYVTPPPRTLSAARATPPPHATGGAVDVTLGNADGEPMQMGADFDQFDELAWPAHFEPLTARPVAGVGVDALRWRRRVLFWTMLEKGFAPYPWEYWHFEFGTRRAAAFYGERVARYGLAVPFEPADR